MGALDPQAVQRESEAVIREYGGEICDWLPGLESAKQARRLDAVVRRALILNAMLQISFRAPIPIIRHWIEANGLEGDLVPSEHAILAKSNTELTGQEQVNLCWYIEALWALAWAGSLIEDIPFNKPVGDHLASLCPDLQRNEDGSKFIRCMRLRPHEELFRKLDLYYRLHWWTRNAQLTGQETGDVRLDIIMERRKALEWVLNAEQDWDNVEMST